MSELEFASENQVQEELQKPNIPATKLYGFIFLIYFISMLLLFTSC
jgi:hypothetical protein